MVMDGPCRRPTDDAILYTKLQITTNIYSWGSFSLHWRFGRMDGLTDGLADTWKGERIGLGCVSKTKILTFGADLISI